jgi:hypothetical protein
VKGIPEFLDAYNEISALKVVAFGRDVMLSLKTNLCTPATHGFSTDIPTKAFTCADSCLQDSSNWRQGKAMGLGR